MIGMRAARKSGFAHLSAVAAASAWLAACGGGGGDDAGFTPPVNQTPVANAGPDQTVSGCSLVTLAGAGTDSDGTISGFTWTQTGGPGVALSSSGTAAATFSAPVVAGNTVFTFSLVVRDNGGASSAAPDTVSITVTPHSDVMVAVNGQITHDRVPFRPFVSCTAPPGTQGLNFQATFPQASPAVHVEAHAGGGTCLVASGRTDASGNYSLQVPQNLPIAIRAVARLRRQAGLDAAPHWDIAVRDGNGEAAPLPEPYAFTGQIFNSSTPNGSQNVRIPSGWDPITRQPIASGTRQSAPFAILETIHRALTFLVTNAGVTVFPVLNIHWSEQLEAGNTFYASAGGPTNDPNLRFISLAGEANVDVDEFDAHTIAHEFGHYVEDRFSRSDSVGGQHGAGDILDPRVAFGEGFGYAFAAMVLNDPVVRDVVDQGQNDELCFSVESEGPGPQGWFSEASNQEILWDLFDPPVGEAGDQVILPFSSLWSVLVDEQRDTEAVTSIFPFITALKAQGQQVAGIDALVTGEIITAPNMTAFAVGEDNDAGRADILPLYDNIGLGENEGVISTNQFGDEGNRLGARRYLRFAPGSSGTANLNVTGGTAGMHDIDVLVFNRGNLIAQGVTAGNTENVSFPFTGGQVYVFEVYDCANAGCNETTPPGNTTITVTLN